jgi:zinc metalloprotease ZmpB
MKDSYRPALKAQVLTDDANRVRAIRHTGEYWESPTGGGLMTAVAYLRAFASVFEVTTAKLDSLESKVSFLNPREQGEEYRLSEERRQFDSETFGFYQTYLNVPVWRAGLKVTVKKGPNRVVGSEDTSQPAVDASMPSAEKIERYRRLFASANANSVQRRAVQADADLQADATLVPRFGEEEADREGESFIGRVFSFDRPSANERVSSRLIRGRFWIYRYDAAERLQEPQEPVPVAPQPGTPVVRGADEPRPRRKGVRETPGLSVPRPFTVPPVDERVKDGAYYMVAEITFDVTEGSDHLVWRALLDVETDSILYLRPLAADVNGLVYEEDPITKTGTTTPTSASTNATLNPHRDDVVLQNLDPPVAGNQSLRGSFAHVTQVEGPNIAPPTRPTGSDFDYDVRTNNFASVSGYFHVDRIFRTMQDLGFDIPTYMSNTVFPIPVDIRCFDVVNAHCVGNGMGGIGHAGYGIMDTSIPGDPLGRACDPRVHLHEVLGHGILYEAVDSPNMGFTHSAGDSLSLIYFDPDSNCKGVDGTPVGKPGDLRFTYVPWHPSLHRRCDRNVADGWAWNGSRDDAGYGSEEILATTLFNVYRSIGGDHPNLGRRQFASRMTMYLVLRAIGDLTPATDPQYARDFATALMTADAGNWTSEGVFGGAYHKVIRWAFEKQGEYQTPLVTNGSPADGTVNSPGDPPNVDVYIDDGRAGEYPFQHVHWHTTTIWNRRAPDGVFAHQEPEIGATNYAYVKVKNRGTQQAQNVVVYGYHTKPGAGLNWPADFASFATASINVGTINGNSSQEVVAGPFKWTPNINAYGHDCMLMVVKADGDASNVDNFTAGETVPEWRLVPNDNNVGQRNVVPVAGGGGERGLMASFDGVSFFVGNPNPRRGRMTFNVIVPSLLTELGWRLELVDVGDGFTLASGAKREVFIKLHPGRSFTRDAVEATRDRDIRIEVLANDNVIGGMTYRFDPDLSQPWNRRPRDKDQPFTRQSKDKDKDCLLEGQRLAECLGIKQPIKKVCVKEIIVGLKVDDDCC